MSSDIHDIEHRITGGDGQKPDNKDIEQNFTLQNIGQRLQIFINHLNISNNKFGQVIGISGSMISHMINGNNFGIDKLVKIVTTYPQLNPEWLLTGQGRMLKEAEENKTSLENGNGKDYDFLLLENKFLKEQLKGKDNELKAHAALNTALQEIISLIKK